MSTVTIHVGSNLDVLPTLAENSIDAIVTDPPYELGFMGKAWDASGIAYNVELWRQCLSVLKPGGHLLAFSGSRTYHRMTCAIEDAGFEVRDQIMWVYGSGFPKSHNISKALDKDAGVEPEIIGRNPNSREESKQDDNLYEAGTVGKTAYITKPTSELAKKWDGWGTALKPAHEPICVARKPLNGTVADNVMKWGTGAINVDGCRVGNDASRPLRVRDATKQTDNNVYEGRMDGSLAGGSKAAGETTQGRWPANLIHDGSDEVLELFPETGPSKASKRGAPPHYNGQVMKDLAERGHDDNGGSAARFFYCPKASKRDRNEGCENIEAKPFQTSQPYGSGADARAEGNSKGNPNNHPTVKPTELMRYLCRLVTPPGGTVLDPFMGSGSTGRGAVLEGFAFTGIELSDEYAVIARARIDAALKSRQTPS